MAWTFDGNTLDIAEEPHDGEIEFITPRKWAFANARGLTGRIKQKLYNDAREAHFHDWHATQATVDMLSAIYQTDAPFTFICPRAPYESGISMLMTEFSALWDGSVRGDAGDYRVTMTLVED